MTDILERLPMSYCDDCNISDCDKDTEYCKADIISAYEQGRADKEKELQGIKDFGALYSEIRADERAKVFEEIIDLLKSKAWVEDENTWLFFNSVLVPISMVISEIEQLKEQKNVNNDTCN